MAKSKKKPVKKAAAKAKPVAKKKVAPIPPGYHTVTPYLVCRNAAAAIEFYKKALGAKEKLRMEGPGGMIAHAEITVNGSVIMLGDESPQMNQKSPQTLGGAPGGVFLYLPDVDKAWARAIAAGAKAEMPPTDMFWGDRYCKFSDPFGHNWSMGTHIEDVSDKETARRAEKEMAKFAPKE